MWALLVNVVHSKSNEHKNILLTGLSLMCFGLLRKMESLLVQRNDVSIREDHVDMQFSHRTKRSTKVFTFKGYECMKEVFLLCITQLDEKRTEDSRFMKILNEKKGARLQNMGEHAIGRMVKELVKRLGKDPSKFTTKSLRRSSATHLAEVVLFITGLQMVGNYKGVTTPMEHVEHSNWACTERMNMLDGEEQHSPPKKQKCNNTNEGGGIVQNNCTIINIISSTVGSVGDALRLGGVVKEDNKEEENVLKDE